MKQTKTKNNFILYMVLMFAVLAIMLISPSLNKKIYAYTYVNEASAQPQLDSDAVSDIKKEIQNDYAIYNSIYEKLNNLNLTKNQKPNYDFSKVNKTIQEKTFGHKDALHLELSDDFIRQGKMFDAVGDKRVEEGRYLGYSLTELNQDAGVFCIEEGAPLRGAPRGQASSYVGVQDQYIKSNVDSVLGDTLGKDFSGIASKVISQLKSQDDKLLSKEGQGSILSGRNISLQSGAKKNGLLSNVDIVGTGNQLIKQASSALKEGELIAALESFGVSFDRDNAGGLVIPENQLALAQNALTKLKQGITIADKAGLDVHGAMVSIKKAQNALTNANADIAFMYTEFEKRAYKALNEFNTTYLQDVANNLTEPHKLNDHSIQAAIWSSEIAQQVPKWGKNLIALAADDFKMYWGELRNFERAHGGIQKLEEGVRTLFADGYWQNALISQNKDSGRAIGAGSGDGRTNSYPDTPDKAVIKNPQIKYQPRILPGDNPDGTPSSIADSRVVNFDKNSQKWIIGPFKLDYVSEGTKYVPSDENRKSSEKRTEVDNSQEDKTAKKDVEKYFSGITHVYLKGIYEDNNGKTIPETKEKPKNEPVSKSLVQGPYLALDQRTAEETTQVGTTSRPEVENRESADKWKDKPQDAMNPATSSFSLRKEEESQKLQDVKNWRLKVKRNNANVSGKKVGPGMEKKDKLGNYTYGLPAPGENFFVEVDYDPALKSIKKLRFEFAYMVFGGESKEFAIVENAGQLKDVKKYIDASLSPVNYYPPGVYPDKDDESDSNPLDDFNTLIDAFGKTGKVEGKAFKTNIQTVSSGNDNNNQRTEALNRQKINSYKKEIMPQRAKTVITDNYKYRVYTRLNGEKVLIDSHTKDGKINKKVNTLKDPSVKRNINFAQAFHEVELAQAAKAQLAKIAQQNAPAASAAAQESGAKVVENVKDGVQSTAKAIKDGSAGSQTSGVEKDKGKTKKGYVVSSSGSEASAKVDMVTSQLQSVGTGTAARWPEEVATEIDLDFKTKSNPQPFNLAIPIGGKVWEDKPGNNKKNVAYDNILGTEADQGMESVKVTIFRDFVKLDDNGNVFDILDRQYARLYDGKGTLIKNYNQIYTDENGSYGPYNIKDVGFTGKELTIVKKDFKHYGVIFDVRFDYDGIKYEPVIPLQTNSGAITDPIDTSKAFNKESDTKLKKTLFNSSHAFENKDVRIRYNAVNAKIAGKNPLNGEQTIGKVIPVDTQNGVLPVDGSKDGRDIEYKVKSKLDKANQIERISSDYVSKHPGNDRVDVKNQPEFKSKFINASTLNMGLKLPANEKIRLGSSDKKIDNAFQELAGVYYNTRDYMKHINLGLKKRQAAQITVEKSLNNAMLTVNKKSYNYDYKDMDTTLLTNEEKEQGLGYTVDLNSKMQVADQKTVKIQPALDLYKTDFLYRTEMYASDTNLDKAIKNELKDEKKDDKLNSEAGKKLEEYKYNPRELDVYLTYTINVMNRSLVDSIDVNAIDDYYTDKMELVNEEVVKYVEKDPKGNIENKGAGKTNETATDGETVEKTKVKVPLPKFAIKSDSLKHANYDKNLADLDSNIINASGKFKANTTIPKGVTGSRITASKAKNAKILVKPNQAAEIFLTFRVKKIDDIQILAKTNPNELGSLKDKADKGEIKELSNVLALGDFANIAELAAYTTYDAISGLASGKIIEDIAPDNIDGESLSIINSKDKTAHFEIDTDNAAGIKIRIKPENPKVKDTSRKLSGILWEDKKTITNGGIPTGDGQYDSKTEKGIPNFPVTLEERVSVKVSNEAVMKNDLSFNKKDLKPTEYLDVPFIWPNTIKGKGIDLDLKAVTGFESNVLTGANGDYKFTGVPAGNMVVSLDYTSPKDKTKVFNNSNNKGKNSVDAIRNSYITFDDLVPTVRDDDHDREIKFYNGMDFKNTMFYTNNGNREEDKNRGTYQKPLNIDKTWLSKDRGSYNNSYLRDDEYRRAQISEVLKTMTNENIANTDIFRGKLEALNTKGDTKEGEKELLTKLNQAHRNTSMRATTPKLNFSIEYYEKLNGMDKVDNSSILNYSDLYAVEGNYIKTPNTPAPIIEQDVNNINLGLVERPKTKIVMNKEITNINIKSADGKDIVDVKYDISAEISKDELKQIYYGEGIVPESKSFFKKTLNKKESTGYENLLELDRSNNADGKISKTIATPLYKSGFKYINIDKNLLQDATINIKYGIYAYNLSETDRKVLSDNSYKNDDVVLKLREKAYRVGKDVGEATLNYQSNIGQLNKYTFGSLAGLHYYTIDSTRNADLGIGSGKELTKTDVSDVTITNVAEVPSNNMKLNVADSDNQEWLAADLTDLKSLIQNGDDKDTNILDSNKSKVINKETIKSTTGTTKTSESNIDSNFYVVKKFSNKLKPFDFVNEKDITKEPKVIKLDTEDPNYVQKWTVKPSAILSSQDSKELVFENTVEILGYNSSNGRRDIETPGNLRALLDVAYENGKGVVIGSDKENTVPDSIKKKLKGNIVEETTIRDAITRSAGGGEFSSIPKTDRTMLATLIEADSSASEPVTLSPPTGLSEYTEAKTLALTATFAVIIASLVTMYITSIPKKKKNNY